MVKKWGVICTICIIVCLIFVNVPHKPKLVSSITTLDTAYLTILVDKIEIKNVKKLEEKLLQMCREDSFENIKLQTSDKAMPKKLYISVYVSQYDLESGNVYMTIKNDAGE